MLERFFMKRAKKRAAVVNVVIKIPQFVRYYRPVESDSDEI